MTVDFRALANQGVRNLIPYQPGKPIEELERELGITSSIKLASNENPLGASPFVKQALQNMVKQTHIYPDGGCYDLKLALSKELNLPSDHFTIGNGSENILELVIKTFLHHDEEAIISEFAFLTIPILLQSYNVKTTVVPAVEWCHDIDGMISAITKKTKVIFLVNPNNPTGTYTKEQDFFRLMESVPKDVLVVVDEAYNEYIAVHDYPQTFKFLSHFPNLVLSRTFSKVHGLAGLRLGYAISSPEIADMLNRARLPFNVNAFAAKAGCIALSDHEHVQQSVILNNVGMAQLQTAFFDMQRSYIPSVGNFLTVDVQDGNYVYQQLLLEGVIVRPLKAYNMPNHIRVTIGTEAQNERFIFALKKVFALR